MNRMHYSKAQLDAFALRDLEIEAEHAEQQSETGPFYPERGVTAQSMLAYAAKCRELIEKYKNGGAHVEVIARA